MRTLQSREPPSCMPAGDRAASFSLAARETGSVGPSDPRLLDRVRQSISARHYSRRIEKAHVHWIKPLHLFPEEGQWRKRG
jgi:hypothetical protein